jgi:hypothetical protein
LLLQLQPHQFAISTQPLKCYRRRTITNPTTTTAAPPANNPAMAAANLTSATGVPATAWCITATAASHPTPNKTPRRISTRIVIRMVEFYFLVTVAVGETVIASPSAAAIFTLSSMTFA